MLDSENYNPHNQYTSTTTNKPEAAAAVADEGIVRVAIELESACLCVCVCVMRHETLSSFIALVFVARPPSGDAPVRSTTSPSLSLPSKQLRLPICLLIGAATRSRLVPPPPVIPGGVKKSAGPTACFSAGASFSKEEIRQDKKRRAVEEIAAER